MKKFYTLILAVVATALVGCDGRMSATAYNEAIVAMNEKSLDNLSEKMETILDANTSKEQAQTLVDELKAEYSDNVARLGEMKYPEAAADLHKSVTDMMVYVKDDVLPRLAETLNHEPESEGWYDVWNSIDENFAGTAGDLEDKVIEEQEKFAEAVGLTLE